jgi:nucleotide-binding universal stress UspA family protein
MASGIRPVLSLRLKNILFATDFSPCSEGALPFARSIATQFRSTLHLVHVLSPEPDLETPLDRLPELDTGLHDARESMRRLLQRQPLQSIGHQELIERGPLWPVVQHAIGERNIDLIVVGTHGRRGLSKVVLGSVAEEIFRRARCPVLTVGPHLPPDGFGEGRFGSILFATDFSEGSSQALAYALSWARENQARLALVHILPELPEIPESELQDIIAGVRQQLLTLVPDAAGLVSLPDAVVLFGSPVRGILRAAEEEQASLIVMSVRAASGRAGASHIPWATAHRVVCEAHCPVLTVRKQSRES